MKTFILAFVFLVGGTAMAQQQAKKEHKTPEQRATGLTQKMTAKLGLDETQKTKIQNINLGIAQKNDAIRNNTSLSRDEKRTQLKETQTSRNSQYKEVLSADQYAKYEAWEKEKREKMQEKRAEKKDTKGGKVAPVEGSEDEL
ncbi:hypothetical protein [Fluviicola taffensis]|uniref:DUF4890 domain-containing protein n=1 Tax=Fluviicola taffensis (strain DSM 16823 / NCIMB 13979 / RW262) TaxID=755732 RepID=F2III6_FLUTR|nr:hypothetical protein [Fluviicola taffensis]AEA44912.1 hypothetical protein Fluta_2933 [Fluviicola taffensis DSM 16823]